LENQTFCPVFEWLKKMASENAPTNQKLNIISGLQLANHFIAIQKSHFFWISNVFGIHMFGFG
jgi:hypothetical protein